ncbi:MAG: PKD domain-containing protein [Solirubrobacteraceae bacterium]
MSRIAERRGAMVLLACVAAALGLAPGASGRSPSRASRRPAPAHHKIFAGVVPDVPSGHIVARGPVARLASNLPYAGGAVLHSNRTHVIFWAPAASGMSFDPGYEALIEHFLADVATGSHLPSNVYALSGQYTDLGGPAAYDSTYGGAVVASDPLPANGCSEPLPPPLSTGPGWSVCLSDSQLEAEIAHVIAVDNLPLTGRDVYFLVTPDGLGSCEGVGPPGCALGGGNDSGSYCGYHAQSTNGRILYAVIPYNAVATHCQSDNPRPNSSTADPALSTISHEHSEIITDPFGDAWIDTAGNENGDLCIQSFGPILGGSQTGAWNEVIHGGRFFLQEEYSNENGGCAARDEGDPISFTLSGTPRAGSAVRFTGRARDPDGRIVSYAWYFGDRTGAGGRIRRHVFKRPGRYRVVLRSTDSAGLWAYSVRVIRVEVRRARHDRPPVRWKQR